MKLEIFFFALCFLVTLYFAVGQYRRLYRNIHFGKDEEIQGNEGQRWRNVILVAFGQKKMFKRLLPAVLHLFIYVAFLFTQIELIEIIVDGFTGHHRVFASSLGGFYTVMINTIEFLSLFALLATIVFLVRRNLLKVPRLSMPEMKGWPALDANLILMGEIALVFGIFLMNSADGALQQLDPAHYPDTGPLLLSGALGALWTEGLGKGLLIFLERVGWWIHLITVFAFINYLPRSKHLHIFLAFPNVYYNRLKSRGEMINMPDIQQEVRSMMGLETEETDLSAELPEFGAKDVFDLSWKTIMDAYTCTECGRCTSECPANITGKKLSPRKVLMGIRDRIEEIAGHFDTKNEKVFMDGIIRKENFDDGKSLFDYITNEEIHACTTCNACVEACPVLIDPLEPILELRRYEILTEAKGPQEWMPMFSSLENSSSPWQMQEQRQDWAKGQ